MLLVLVWDFHIGEVASGDYQLDSGKNSGELPVPSV